MGERATYVINLTTLGGSFAAVKITCTHTQTHLTHVHQVIVCYDVHRAGQLACWGLLRHLLDAEGLVVLELTHAVLRLQWVVVLVLCGVGRGGWEGLQGGEVTVGAFEGLPRGRTVVDALHHLWVDQGACRGGKRGGE